MALTFEEIRRRELAKSGIDVDVEDVEQDQGEAGIDFTTDRLGRIWSGGVCVGGGNEPELDERDAAEEAEVMRRLTYSPAQLQNLHAIEKEREAWRADEAEDEPGPPPPLEAEECPSCGRRVNLREINPIGGLRNKVTGKCYVHWSCKCGAARVTEPGQIYEAGGADYLERADFEHAVNEEIWAKYVPKPG